MFELPEAKRVRRADLKALDESSWNGSDDEELDVELQAKLNAQIASALGLDQSIPEPLHQNTLVSQSNNEKTERSPSAEEDDDAGREEFAFRLFSTTTSAPKIVLENDEELKGDGGLAGPGRPLSYYVVTEVPIEKRQEYQFAAMSGEEILARSKGRSWGLELPWKVTSITVTRKGRPEESKDGPQRTDGQDEGPQRKRPGKKQRISLRKMTKAREEQQKATAQKLLEKEEQVKDKKKRLNRLKKLRKRAKNKEKKAAMGTAEDVSDASDGESDGSS